MENDYESQFYMDIMDRISENFNDREKTLLIICQKIIELMELLNKIENKKFVKNALIVIIALFEDHGLDFPMKNGRDFKAISKQDREAFNNILKQEISN